MDKPSKPTKKTPSKKPKKVATDSTPSPKAKVSPARKTSSNKSIKSKKIPSPTPTEAKEKHQYFEDLGSRIAQKAYDLYQQRGQEHGHDLEDWLEAERQILPKEIANRS